MIWSAGQGIRGAEIFPWNVFESKVELRQVEQPPGLAAIQIARLSEVSQVFVVCEDLDRGGGAEEIVAPGIEGSHDSEQFLIVDVVVALSRAKRLG